MVGRLVVTLTMRPDPERISSGAALRAIRNVPLTLVTMISRQMSGSASQNFSDLVFGARSRWSGPLPALFTSTCSAPNFFRRRCDRTLAIGRQRDVAGDGRYRPAAGLCCHGRHRVLER